MTQRRSSSLIRDDLYNNSSSKSLAKPMPFTSPPSRRTLILQSSLFHSCPQFHEPTTAFTVVTQIRPWGTIRKEITTMLFASMLNHVVDSWETVGAPKPIIDFMQQIPTVDSEILSVPKNKTKSKKEASSISGARRTKELKEYQKSKSEMSKDLISSHKSSMSRRTTQIITSSMETEADPLYLCWWTYPDEKVIIRFKNGNHYNGNISMMTMHGEGTFRWADGTFFVGRFKSDEIKRGCMYWKNDTWYSGDFSNNVRHGKGLFVDSRTRNYYTGDWVGGTKHGKGKIQFSLNSTYDGDWKSNVRHGYGLREYDETSGYLGEYDFGIQKGKGTMIWPNHDYYCGEWDNGKMHGVGVYIWDTFFNNTMSVPCMNTYNGSFTKGYRNGRGRLKFAHGLASRYDGEFKNDKKHGNGRFVTNNGYIIERKNLFHLDFLSRNESADMIPVKKGKDLHGLGTPISMEFSMTNCTVGVMFHVEKALNNVDRSFEFRQAIIDNYYHTSSRKDRPSNTPHQKRHSKLESYMENLKLFEESSLLKAIQNYEITLRDIYYYYATVCNEVEITFSPLLIRLYLWQFYYDIEIHHRGLTLVQIDDLYHSNEAWLSLDAHDPFEKIYFWQFIHCLILIANELYAKKSLPEPRPDTIMAVAFRQFMEEVVLLGARRRSGNLPNEYGKFVPLMCVYQLYKTIGEPHSVRDFIQAVHRPPFDPRESSEFKTKDIILPDEYLAYGRNLCLYKDKLQFITETQEFPEKDATKFEVTDQLPLFNLKRLSTDAIIDIFSELIPQIKDHVNNLVLNLDVQITFYEFFEAIIECIKRINAIIDEEIRLNELMSEENTVLE